MREPARCQEPPLASVFGLVRWQANRPKTLVPDPNCALKLGFPQRLAHLGNRGFVDALLTKLLGDPCHPVDGRLAVNQPLNVSSVGLPAFSGKGVKHAIDFLGTLCVGRELACEFDPTVLTAR